MKLDLQALEYFVKIADSRSLSAAASLYGIPKSSMSFKLRQLESGFGVKLFQRDGHSLIITDAGSELLKHARRLLTSSASAVEQMAELRDHVAGTLHLAHTGEFGTAFSGQLLLAFRQQYPKIKVSLTIYEHSALLTSERLKGFDAVLSWDTHRHDDDEFATALSSIHFGLFASPSYLQANSAITKIEDLRQHKGMIYVRPSGQQVWHLVCGDQSVDILPRSDFEANDFWTIKYLAVAGEGLAYLPAFFTEIECRRGLLRPVLADWKSDTWWINLRVPRAWLASKKIAAFVAFCKDFCDGDFKFRGPRNYVDIEIGGE